MILIQSSTTPPLMTSITLIRIIPLPTLLRLSTPLPILSMFPMPISESHVILRKRPLWSPIIPIFWVHPDINVILRKRPLSLPIILEERFQLIWLIQCWRIRLLLVLIRFILPTNV